MKVKIKNLLNDYIRGPFGSALKKSDMIDHGIVVYEQNHIIYNNRDFRYYISEEKFEKLKRFMVKTNDIIVSCSGTIGCVSMIKEDDPKGIINQALLILRVNENLILPKYLMYFLKTIKGKRSITISSTGSVQENIAPRGIIENIEINLPSIEEQKEIVKKIEAFQRKLELDYKYLDKLQEICETIFYKWFVEFNFPNKYGEEYKKANGKMYLVNNKEIPIGWNISTVSQTCNIIMGQSPPSSTYNCREEGIPFYQGVVDFGKKYPGKSKWCSEPIRKAMIGDILLSVRAPVGKLNVALEECCIGRGLSAISLPDSNNYYAFYEIQRRMRILMKKGNGTIFNSIKKNDIQKLVFLNPDKNVLDMFERTISPLEINIKRLSKEIEIIQKLQKYLLNKLVK